jgi:hypothetical protein
MRRCPRIETSVRTTFARCLAFFLWVAVVPGCAGWRDHATELVYLEHEPGLAPYRTRMIVSAGYLRIDDGNDAGDFLLFDRASRIVYSVSGAERRVLVITPRAVSVGPPIALAYREERDAARFPAVDGHTVVHYRQWTNDQLCRDLYAARDLLPQAVAALREYRAALAGRQALTVAVTPKEFETPCDLADNVFRPGRYLDHGLPVRMTDGAGKLSELVDYRSLATVPQRLFALPSEYPRLSIDDIGGG